MPGSDPKKLQKSHVSSADAMYVLSLRRFDMPGPVTQLLRSGRLGCESTEARSEKEYRQVRRSSPRLCLLTVHSVLNVCRQFRIAKCSKTAQESDPGARELLVRVNSRPTGLTEDDLAAVLDSNLIEGIVIPKVHSGDDVRWVLDLIRRLSSAEVAGRLRLLASIESARAILNLAEVRACTAAWAVLTGWQIAQASGQVDTLLVRCVDSH